MEKTLDVPIVMEITQILQLEQEQEELFLGNNSEQYLGFSLLQYRILNHIFYVNKKKVAHLQTGRHY